MSDASTLVAANVLSLILGIFWRRRAGRSVRGLRMFRVAAFGLFLGFFTLLAIHGGFPENPLYKEALENEGIILFCLVVDSFIGHSFKKRHSQSSS